MLDDDFDFSDSTSDGVREILDVAVGVLQDYGTEGNTRIERMARWLLVSLMADVPNPGDAPASWTLTPDQCRSHAIYWLLCAERQEH